MEEPRDKLTDALLPGVPHEVLDRYRRAAGNEIDSGKFTSPESSAALAANTFGFFMNRPRDLPPFARWTASWPPLSVVPEEEVRFPWAGGRHPWLDAVVETEDFVIGVESKRYEPFRAHSRPADSAFSEAYWRDHWGTEMQPYQWVRDGLAHRPQLFRYLDAPQLVKHAFGLRTQALKKDKKAALVYLFAEPKAWPGTDGKAISQDARAGHAEEVRWFARMVTGGEVDFGHMTYDELLSAFDSSSIPDVREHARRVRERFAIS